MATNIEQMNANIAKIRADGDKLRADMEMDQKKYRVSVVTIFLQVFGLVIGSVAAGVALATYVHPHH